MTKSKTIEDLLKNKPPEIQKKIHKKIGQLRSEGYKLHELLEVLLEYYDFD